MRWPPWRRIEDAPPVVDPKPARDAARALREAKDRWEPVLRVRDEGRKVRAKNHFAENVRAAMGAHE